MLRLLKVRHFRCFEAFEAEFSPGLNLIAGPNARGKTSLLEAACVLLRLQSPRVARLGDVIQHDRKGFVVDGFFGDRHLQFYHSPGRKKLALDSVEQKGAGEYLQVGRMVYFATSDIELVRGSGSGRRRFLDFIAAQLDGGYRRALLNYERALRSRNALLKAPVIRWREVEAFDEPLLAAGSVVRELRAGLIGRMQPHADAAHHAISSARENLHAAYAPGGGGDFATALREARGEDGRLRQTTVGPHRDDLQFLLAGKSAGIASEGQQRTLVLALKLGAARLLQEASGVAPMLLLDDIFGELDLSRRAALMAALPEESQKLVTLTHLDWMGDVAPARILRLEH